MSSNCRLDEVREALSQMTSLADHLGKLVERDSTLSRRAAGLRVSVRLLLYSIPGRQTEHMSLPEATHPCAMP